MVPLSGSSRPAMSRERVVFPEPDSPTTPRASPACKDRLTESRATTPAVPRRGANFLVTRSTTRIGSRGWPSGLTAASSSSTII